MSGTQQTPIRMTERAAAKIKDLLAAQAQPAAGLRFALRGKGCSGFSYVFDIATTREAEEEEIRVNDIALFVDQASFLYLVGTEIDYVDEPMRSRFVFNNPNAKAQCGCGDSFAV